MFAGDFKRRSSQTASIVTLAAKPTQQPGGKGYLNSAENTNSTKALTGEGFKRGVVPIIGIELMTYRLQGGCSTN